MSIETPVSTPDIWSPDGCAPAAPWSSTRRGGRICPTRSSTSCS